eukprot:3558891-Amphidinium_carterae.2
MFAFLEYCPAIFQITACTLHVDVPRLDNPCCPVKNSMPQLACLLTVAQYVQTLREDVLLVPASHQNTQRSNISLD